MLHQENREGCILFPQPHTKLLHLLQAACKPPVPDPFPAKQALWEKEKAPALPALDTGSINGFQEEKPPTPPRLLSHPGICFFLLPEDTAACLSLQSCSRTLYFLSWFYPHFLSSSCFIVFPLFFFPLFSFPLFHTFCLFPSSLFIVQVSFC